MNIIKLIYYYSNTKLFIKLKNVLVILLSSILFQYSFILMSCGPILAIGILSSRFALYVYNFELCFFLNLFLNNFNG